MKEHWKTFLLLCACRFSIPPMQFWQLSVPELEVLLSSCSSNSGKGPLGRENLEQMIRDYPDVKDENETGIATPDKNNRA